MPEDRDKYFAAVGDVHGNIYAMLGLLQSWSQKNKKDLSFVLQVGEASYYTLGDLLNSASFGGNILRLRILS